MPKSPRTDQLFLGLTFWVSRQIPSRTEFIKNLQDHGGTVVDKQSENSFNLINLEKNKSNTTSLCYDYNFVLDSLEQKRLLDDGIYEVRDRHPVTRAPGSASTLQKSTRTKFTPEDDQILYNWVEPLKLRGERYRGNTIYERLAKKYPHHPFQSWRDRYLNYVEPRTDMRVTEHLQTDPDDSEETLERSGKRRRLNESATPIHHRSKSGISSETVVESIEVQPGRKPLNSRSPGDDLEGKRRRSVLIREPTHESAEGSWQVSQEDEQSKDQSLFFTPEREVIQALPRDRYSQTSISRQGFNYEEADRLYAAVPAICNTSPEKLKHGWVTMAAEWKGHSVRDWKAYYEDHIFPEYRRANGIKTQGDLDAHIASIEVQSYSSSLFDENTEHTSAFSTNGINGRSLYDPEDTSKHSGSGLIEEATNEAGLQDRAAVVTENQASSSSNAKSSVQHVGITANEGRKRVTQQTNVDSAHSSVAPSPNTPSSQKKRLFGRVFQLSGVPVPTQPSVVTQLEATSVQISMASSVPAQSNISSTSKTNAASSSLSLPTVHKPPQSFQIPPKSLTTSQDSANYETALRLQGVPVEATEEPVLPEHITDLSDGDEVDLLDGERTDSEPDLAEHPPSDTGSEYVAFETEVERSQMWETESQFEGEVTDSSDDGDPQHEARPRSRSATPLMRQPSAETNDGFHHRANHRDGYPSKTHGIQQPAARVETQALFKKLTQLETSVFDLPDPDGGWETLGIIEDPDEAIETVELPDDPAIDQKRSTSLDASFEEPNSANSDPIAVAQTSNLVAVSPNSVEDGADPVRATRLTVKEEGLHTQDRDTNAPLPATATSTYRGTDSVDADFNANVSTISTTKFSQNSTFALWINEQRAKYTELPELVFMRLASTASQAINLSSVTTATLLLKTLVDSFVAYESHRQANYKQQNPGARKRLKPSTSLTAAQAKRMLPDDVRGVWTSEDDDRLTSSSHVSITLNENKHGRDGVQQRIDFLRTRYNLKAKGTANKGAADARSTFSSKRKR